MSMGMNEARLRLMHHKEQRIRQIIGSLHLYDETLKNAHRVLVQHLNAAETVIRDNLSECQGMAASGIYPEELRGMMDSYRVALENTGRIRDLMLSLTGIPASMANVRANLSVASHQVNKALGS